MNDLELLLTSFDSLVFPQPIPPPGQQSQQLKQNVTLDILLKGNQNQILTERWTFSLSLAQANSAPPRHPNQSLLQKQSNQQNHQKLMQYRQRDEVLSSPRSSTNSMSNFHKRLCVLVRSILSLSLSLPLFTFIKNNKKNITNKLQQQQQQHQQAQQQQVKSDYQISVNREKNLQKFPTKVQIKKNSIISLPFLFGTLNVQVEYMNKDDIQISLSQPQPQPQNNSLQDMLMQALGPSNNMQGMNMGMGGIVQQPSKVQTAQADNRFRCNSDTTYNCLPASKRRFKIFKDQKSNIYSPRVSEGIMIKEDYFTADKNKLFYQVSTRNSGNSYESSHSNLSSENSKKLGVSPYILGGPLQNQGQIGQGQGLGNNQIKASQLLKSSLDGALIDPYDAPLGSARPSKPRVDPFKKFDNLPSSRNRNFRLSFDDGQQRLKTQDSSNSLNQVVQAAILEASSPSMEVVGGQASNKKSGGFIFRKGSMNVNNFTRTDFNSLTPVEHQLIEEEDHTEFELNIQSDVSHKDKEDGTNDDILYSKNSKNLAKDATRSQSLLKIADENGNESFYYPSPIKSESSDDEYETLKKLKNENEFSQPKFQRKTSKFIGFLEEMSNEESSSNEQDDEHIDDEERIRKFQSKIQEFIIQNKRSYGGNQQQQPAQGDNSSLKKQQSFSLRSQQSELRDNFFNLLEMREIMLEKMSSQVKLQNYIASTFKK